MNRVLAELKCWGCDVEGAMKRMLDDEDFYIECLNEVANDGCFESLKAALDSKNVNAAFEAAHALKGVFANVGLTPFFNKIVEIVEPLRRGNGEELGGKYEELIQMREKLKKLLSED